MYPSGVPALVKAVLADPRSVARWGGPTGNPTSYVRSPMAGNSPSPADLGYGGQMGSLDPSIPPGYTLDQSGLLLPPIPGVTPAQPCYSAVFDTTRFGYIFVQNLTIGLASVLASGQPNPVRSYLFILNWSASGGPTLWVNFNNPAAVGQGIPIYANGGYIFQDEFVDQSNIYLAASAAGCTVSFATSNSNPYIV